MVTKGLVISLLFFALPSQANPLEGAGGSSGPTTYNASKITTHSLDARLLNDLSRKDHINVVVEWSKIYDHLDYKFKGDPDAYGDLYGLNKGSYWGLCEQYVDNELGQTIVDEFGATGGKSKAQETIGYRAGMVYFYVKYQLLKCE